MDGKFALNDLSRYEHTCARVSAAGVLSQLCGRGALISFSYMEGYGHFSPTVCLVPVFDALPSCSIVGAGCVARFVVACHRLQTHTLGPHSTHLIEVLPSIACTSSRAWTAIIKAARDSRMTCTCAPLESATEFPGKHDRHVSVSGRRHMAKLAWQ